MAEEGRTNAGRTYPGPDLHESGPRLLRVRPGFTLVEAIIVVMIVGVLLSLAAPSFQGFGNELHNASRESAAIFRQARSLAMSRTAAYRIVVASSDELRTEFASTCNAGSWQPEPRLRLHLQGGVVMQGTPIVAGSTLVCYSSRGLGDASPTFEVRDRRGSLHRIEVFTGGAVTITPVVGGP